MIERAKIILAELEAEDRTSHARRLIDDLPLFAVAARTGASAPSGEAVENPILTALERRVADENLDVQIATTRIAESRAQLGVVGAAQFPALKGIRRQWSFSGSSSITFSIRHVCLFLPDKYFKCFTHE